MKLTVVTCDCQQALPHRKFQTEKDGTSDGFFSLVEGRFIIATLKDQGRMSDTEVADADAQLTASGLPEFSPYEDSELDFLAAEIIANVPPAVRGEYVTKFAGRIGISPASTDLLRAKLQLAPAEVHA